MQHIQLGRSDLRVSPICLGTMTFGQQVNEPLAHSLLDSAVAQGINFIDTAEMYSIPARKETYGATEKIIGTWFASRPGVRDKVVLATKVAGPSRNMDWIRNGAANLMPADIAQACDDSLKRLQTDRIDLYQLHWPNRNSPAFGAVYFDPKHDKEYSSIHEQLEAFGKLVKAGKVRYIGLSNETPWGVSEFIKLAEQHDLPRVATVQNPYALTSRAVDNGLDETLYRLGVSLLAYSPLAFGALTGKYDETGFETDASLGRLAAFETSRKQRWGRPAALQAARMYNQLARKHDLTPTQLALAFCYNSWRVSSTIIGVTNQKQLDENLAAASVKLSPQVLTEIDEIRLSYRDPAQ